MARGVAADYIVWQDRVFRAKQAGATMQEGLYKVEMHTVHGSRRGVIYVWDGKMMGGNSAFAFIGTYRDGENDEVLVDISSMRHNDDPKFQPLFKVDKITLSLTGRRRGTQYLFEGGTTQLPRIAFNSVMTPISEAAAPPVPPAGKGGIGNGLYSIHIRMLDGLDGGNTGVMVLHDGQIRGGDAFFDYIGSCASSNGKWKGELVNHEHTPSQGARPVFGGHEVGIGFSGSYDDEGAVAEATALAGKRSIRFSAVLKRLVKT
jgi:hypothetical protein